MSTPQWFAQLTLNGLFISPAKVIEFFSGDTKGLSEDTATELRQHLGKLNQDPKHLADCVKYVCINVLGWTISGIIAAPDKSWSRVLITREAFRPDMVWKRLEGYAPIPVFRVKPQGQWPACIEKPLGVGKGRRDIAKVVEWMRRAEQNLAVVTNGRYFRLLYANPDSESWVDFDIQQVLEDRDHHAAFTQLMGIDALKFVEGDTSKLLKAIQSTRQGQSELSSILGERLRRAIEIIIRHSNPQALIALDEDQGIEKRDIYIAACRIMMRCVVVFFAEARDLLPRNNVVYNHSYSLQGLAQRLKLESGGNKKRLRHRYSAWPRILALFRLVHQGSAHSELTINAYGGELFRPGNSESHDPISRALAVFENPSNDLSDEVIHDILELLTESRAKVKVGGSNKAIPVPVDFSALSTEYIGIIYEGLLDYELHRVQPNEPMIMLPLGSEPILPLERLREMSQEKLGELLTEFKKSKKSKATVDGEESAEDEEAAEEDELVDEESEDEEVEASDDSNDDSDEEDDEPATDTGYYHAALEWARNAVIAAGLVTPPKGAKSPEKWTIEFTEQREKAAQKLVSKDRLFLPDTWYLARWGGTRKGSGTYYTRPQLAIPTVSRTLEPLVYNRQDDGTLEPKRPEEILALKVCDPAMGSASFPVAALRYLTEALYQSLLYHSCILDKDNKSYIRLADGHELEGMADEPIPVPPDHEEFERMLKARLKRYVVERCIYGVDFDPLAVELGRLALWIETMDRDLPFGFLDHKIKCGNSLVGCWLDQFMDYPVLAFVRSADDGGDKNHKNGVHFQKEVIGKTLKKRLNDQIKPEICQVIENTIQRHLPKDTGIAHLEVHQDLFDLFEQLHDLPIHETRAREALYREKVSAHDGFKRTKLAMDTWCALWFWPFDKLELVPTPTRWHSLDSEAQTVVETLSSKLRFFHWELEFPDVFTVTRTGFDAILGNPPWETLQPESKEFFSNKDPLYRTYGKQEALRVQTKLFEDQGFEREWIDYNAHFKSVGNFFTNRANPYGDANARLGGSGTGLTIAKHWTESDRLHEIWRDERRKRQGLADKSHPFCEQGTGKAYTYKLFLELAHGLLRDDGYMGFIVPSGVYTDKGTTALRRLFLEKSRWHWLFGFENRNKIFDIDSRFKFNPIIVQKGGTTTAIKAAFMHRELADWENADKHVLSYPAERIKQFSPKSLSILEIRGERDLEILQKIYSNGVLLGDDSENGWGVSFQQGDFNMTSDSKLFKTREKAEAEGYKPNQFSFWEGPNGDILLPLYQGAMVHQHDPFYKGWLVNKDGKMGWAVPSEWPTVSPQHLIHQKDYQASTKTGRGRRVGFRDIARGTDQRTMIATVMPPYPTGNKVPTLETSSWSTAFRLSAVLNTFTFDWVQRIRQGSTSLNWYIIAENPLPQDPAGIPPILVKQLCALNPINAFHWITENSQRSWQRGWALTGHERLRLKCMLDAIVAEMFGLSRDDFAWILKDCDHSAQKLSEKAFIRQLDPKGFWRTDKGSNPEVRQTVLSLVAFHALQDSIEEAGDRNLGINWFCEQNDGEGWMLPSTLCIANLNLPRSVEVGIYDETALVPQPVASRLGPRFYDWQLEQSVDESWEECARHAELLEMILPKTHAPESSANISKTSQSRQVSLLEQGGE